MSELARIEGIIRRSSDPTLVGRVRHLLDQLEQEKIAARAHAVESVPDELHRIAAGYQGSVRNFCVEVLGVNILIGRTFARMGYKPTTVLTLTRRELLAIRGFGPHHADAVISACTHWVQVP